MIVCDVVWKHEFKYGRGCGHIDRVLPAHTSSVGIMQQQKRMDKEIESFEFRVQIFLPLLWFLVVLLQ